MIINVTLLAVMAVMYAVGVYLVTERSLTRILLGLMLLTNATNLLLLTTGGYAGLAPVVEDLGLDSSEYNDPLPQAMTLTAIVISFATTAFFVALIYRAWVISRQDELEDDDEDLRVAQQSTFDAEEDAEIQMETSEFGEDPNVDYELAQPKFPQGPAAIGASAQVIPADADESPGSHRRDSKVAHRKLPKHRGGEF